MTEETKARRRAWTASWRKRNAKHIKDYSKAYHARSYPTRRKAKIASSLKYASGHKDKVRAYQAAYYAKNKKQLRQKHAAYSAKNKKKLSEYSRGYRQANRLKLAIKKRAYWEANRAAYRNNKQARRAREKGSKTGDQSLILKWREKIASRPRINCYWCSVTIDSDSVHVDHVIALALGGAHSIDNLCASCCDCNRRKSAKSVEEWNEILKEPVLL